MSSLRHFVYFLNINLMATSRDKKIKALEEISQSITSAKSVSLVDTKGWTVEEISTLRKNLREKESVCVVVKKTLIHKAIQDICDIDFNVKALEGNISLVFSFADPVSGPKIVKQYIKKVKKGTLYAGIMDNKILENADIMLLADLPGREELLARLIGTCQAPISGIQGVLQGVISGFVRTLDALHEQKST